MTGPRYQSDLRETHNRFASKSIEPTRILRNSGAPGKAVGSTVRDYLHVVDLADGHVAALDALGAHPGCTAVNLGTGVGHTVLEVVAAAGEVVGTPVAHEVVGRRPGDIARIWADPTLASEILGWRATRSLNDMLSDHWRWQQQNPTGY